jgi:6-phosphogluconolactonase
VTFVVRPTVEALADALAEAFEATAWAAIAARGLFTCALTGGSAAKGLYPRLARADVNWKKTHVYFGDERCVPPDDAESNFRLAHDVLLGPAGVPPGQVHRVRGELSPGAAAAEYARALPVLDVVHLGMGPDGHVCSLFPGHPLLAEATARVAALTDSPKPPPARVTLTLPALREAGALWFLVTGEAKREVVREAVTDATSALPAARAHRDARSSTWFLDAAAAALLPARP